MRMARILGLLLPCVACAPTAPLATAPSHSSQPCSDTAAGPQTVAAPTRATDPCAAEQTTLAIETCVTEHVRRVENDIQAALTRFTGVLNARGIPDAAALTAASQSDWERYRGSQCQLFEKLSEGGSIARIAVAYCRRDLAEARLADLRALEQSVVE